MVKKAKGPQPTIIDPKTSAYSDIGLQWPVKGSRGDTYTVTLERTGWRCNCMGFYGHRHCKHITQIDQLLGGDHDDPFYAIRQGLWDGN